MAIINKDLEDLDNHKKCISNPGESQKEMRNYLLKDHFVLNHLAKRLQEYY